MSKSVSDCVVDVLEPLVGRPVAQICISSAAIKIGKSSEALTAGDLEPQLVEVRGSMGSFASADLLDRAIDDIRVQAFA